MKHFALPLLLALVLTGCSTYQYSARTVGVNRKNVHTKPMAVEVVPDYGRKVTASSDYQMTKNDAIAEAEYRCITESNIDVVVDPIIKVERAPLLQKKYRATITGYAGTYKEAKAGVEAVIEYNKEDIEKYKLLSDPDFAKYYYSKGAGDTYYINSEVSATKQKQSLASLAFAPQSNKPVKQFDFMQSKKLRNAGIGLTIGGLIATYAIGIPCLMAEGEEYWDGYNSYYYTNDAAVGAGIAFLTIGSAAVAAGIPMWCVGSTRMKKSNNNLKVSVGGAKNGLGLRVNF